MIQSLCFRTCSSLKHKHLFRHFASALDGSACWGLSHVMCAAIHTRFAMRFCELVLLVTAWPRHEGKLGVFLNSGAYKGGQIPDDCVAIYQTRQRNVARETEMADADDECREGQLDETFNAAREQMMLTTKGSAGQAPSK